MFIDRIFAEGIRADEHDDDTEILLGAIETATVFRVDNVADFYFRAATQDKHWRIADFPNLAPPLGRMFFEFAMPPGVWAGVRSAGVLMLAWDTSAPALWIGAGETAVALPDGRILNRDQVDPEVIRWVLNVVTLIDIGGRIWALSSNQVCIDPRGVPVSGSKGVGRLLTGFEIPDLPPVRLLECAGRLILYPVYLALSFLHCKNVSVAATEPPARLNRARAKENKRPLVRYHVLEIEPMRRILQSGGYPQVRLQRALHICRGHFADYTNGAGLFGKHHGVYWVDQHARGKASEGIVVKDYAVKSAGKTDG